MSVSNGQTANASTFNTAFASKSQDNTITGVQNFASTAPASGSAVANVQRELNAHASVLGISLAQVYNYLITWASDTIGSANDTVKARVEAIVAALPWRGGAASISNGASSKAITFSSAMADTTYSIDFAIENVTDASPIFLQGVVTAKATTGFTVTFNAPTDSANYVLSWHARKAG